MGADWPDEANEPSEKTPDNRDGQSSDGRPVPAETRSRQEQYTDQYQAVSATAQTQKWDKVAAEARWMWGEYLRRWPPEERPPVDKSADPPGSWRADGDRFLPTDANGRVDTECDHIVNREKDLISPALRAAESQDPDRHLIGFDRRLKDRDRIKEKVCDKMEEYDFSPEEAISSVSDTIRYTFQYREAHYTQGVLADIGRLKDQGFELDKLRNSWDEEEYKGINSQWIEPGSSQRFEVQFHTHISFEAKQLTHGAYERLRTQQADEFEKMVLKAFQRKVSADIPVPPGATDIPDYLEREADAR